MFGPPSAIITDLLPDVGATAPAIRVAHSIKADSCKHFMPSYPPIEDSTSPRAVSGAFFGHARTRLQILLKPLSREPRHLFKRARLFKQMRSIGHDLQLLLATQLRISLLVQLDHRRVVAADDEERRRFDARQGRACEVGSAAARDDRAYLVANFGRCPERCAATRRRTD